MPFDKRTLVLPPGTVFEEKTVLGEGDLILGNHVRFGFGLRTDGRIFLGQGAEVEGELHSGGDLRVDTSTRVLGNATTGANGFLGERCFVQGDLVVEGDLDVGDDVRVTGALKAKGWVQKRSPVPLMVYVFLYVLELLRLGQSAEVERILKELEETEAADDIAVDEVFLFVPDHSKVGLTDTDVHGALEAGKECRILGNWAVRGNAVLGEKCRLFGALRADGDIQLSAGTEVQGEVAAGGHVVVRENVQILGDLRARSVEVHPGATVDGKIVAQEGVTFRTAEQARAQATAEGKVEEFKGKAADLVDLLG